jgi:nicotinic acid mononucleotide adenylyltransferase
MLGPPMGSGTLGTRERRRLAPLAAALGRAGGTAGPPRLEAVAGHLPRSASAGLLAGTFNPFTRAHAALAVAGHRAGCQLVVLAMAPVSLAKEGLERAHPVDRLDWVATWARRHPWAVAAAASHPLLVDMAEALRRATGAEVALLLGADKAAQLVEPHWYGDPVAAMARLERTATLLVAERAGHPEPDLPVRAAPLPTAAWVPERSATQARAAAARGLPLDELVPAAVAKGVERTGAYAPGNAYLARIQELDALVTSAGDGEARLPSRGP